LPFWVRHTGDTLVILERSILPDRVLVNRFSLREGSSSDKDRNNSVPSRLLVEDDDRPDESC
jgi:hypothetical protein